MTESLIKKFENYCQLYEIAKQRNNDPEIESIKSDIWSFLKNLYGKKDIFLAERILKQNVQKPKLNQLYFIVEFLRAGGNVSVKELILLFQICNYFKNDNVIFEDSIPMFFINEIYDIIHHGDCLEGGGEITGKEYFNLTMTLLDEKFHHLIGGNDKVFSYDGCIYFIMMSNGWFEERESEFILIWDKIQFHLDNYGREHHLSEYWIESYENFVKKHGI